jgi:hypothetical protein
MRLSARHASYIFVAIAVSVSVEVEVVVMWSGDHKWLSTRQSSKLTALVVIVDKTLNVDVVLTS